MPKTLVNGSAPYRSAGLLDQYAFDWPTGNIWYVDSTNGVDAVPPRGQTPDFAFATLDYAISQATADNDDWILLRPNFAETITSAAQINVNKKGLTIVGQGYGRERATFNYTTSVAASFDINSANCRIANCVFTLMGVASLTTGLNVKAADCLIEDCEIEFANGTNQATQAILTTSAANRLHIRRCHLHGTNNAGTTRAITIVGGTDSIIEDCDIIGAFTTTVGGISIITTAAVNLLLKNLRIQNLTAVSTKAITDVITATTGQISDCRFQILSGTAPVTAATMSWVGNNRYAAALGTSDSAL